MARQNIQFKGMRHTPSDITGQDGDLLECVNLIHENGELKPIELPEKTTMKGVYSNETLVAVHNLTDGKKYVYAVWNTSTTLIHVKNENGDVVLGHGLPGQEIKWADTIGNTLIIGTDKSTHYALYKNGQYKWLGDKLPQPVFWFDLGANSDSECNYIQEVEPYVYCTYNDTTANGIIVNRLADQSSGSYTGAYTFLDNNVNTFDNKKSIRDNLRAKMATLIKKSKDSGRFVFPFLVRYAMRLFDGSYVMHSAPILMLPSTASSPILAYLRMKDKIIQTNYSISDLILECNSKPLKLWFKGFLDADGNELTSSIEDWGDIIRGVDIFLSSQIVTYNDSYYDNIDNIPTQYYCVKGDDIDYGYSYAENTKEDWYNYYTVSHGHDEDEVYDSAWYKNQYFPIQSSSAGYVHERIAETNLFYRVKKYDLNMLKVSEWSDERYLNDEIEYGLLDRLETLPTLPDDYVSRSRMVGSANYNYNQRLILGNISLQAPLWYKDAKKFKNSIDFLNIVFVIEKPEKTIYIKYSCNSGDDGLGKYDFGHYLYYPDVDCKKAIVTLNNNGARYFEVPMYEHSGLNGSYALMPDLNSLWESYDEFSSVNVMDIPDPSTDRYYSLQNTIAMSSVANPFYFPASNFKDIGRAKVIGIAANMLDVSSAQWGQYPLYVFCSDGIVAVAIDGEGKFGGIQAVSADVLREPRGLSQPTLVQTGQALMFLTQRGVMAIGGTKINCMSEAMEGRHFNPMDELDSVDYRVGAFQNLITRTSDHMSFVDFAKNGFLAYDYAHHRVLLLRGDMDYQYVYSMKTGLWSKQIVYADRASYQIDVVPSNELPPQRGGENPILNVKPITAAVNNYTEMYLQDTDGWLYKTMDVAGENTSKTLYQYGYFISRPIRFGTDEYKTITRTLHRYTHFANKSFVKMAVYGSRDGVSYGRINTLRGMSYQYFIFVIYTYLKPNERYSYLSVDFEPRLTNKLR